MPARMELSLAVRWMATVMRKAGVSIRRFPDYFASLDRLFWTSSSFDSSVIGRFPAFSGRFANRFLNFD
jgi:hypothetical protein